MDVNLACPYSIRVRFARNCRSTLEDKTKIAATSNTSRETSSKHCILKTNQVKPPINTSKQPIFRVNYDESVSWVLSEVVGFPIQLMSDSFQASDQTRAFFLLNQGTQTKDLFINTSKAILCTLLPSSSYLNPIQKLCRSCRTPPLAHTRKGGHQKRRRELSQFEPQNTRGMHQQEGTKARS